MSIFDNPDEYYMQQALVEARQALKEGEVPIGAVIESGGHIIARAHNQTERLGDVTAHAEMLAVTAAAETLGGKYLTGCTLYVTVEPCPMCAGALGWAQIERIVYAAPDPKRGYTRLSPSPLHPKTQVEQGLMEEEAAELMKQFFKNKRI